MICSCHWCRGALENIIQRKHWFFFFFFRAESDASLVEWANPPSQQAVRVLIFGACLVTGLYALHKLFGQKLCHFTFNQQKSAQPRQNRRLSNLVKWVAQFFTSLLSSKDFLSLLFKCKLSNVPGLEARHGMGKAQTDWRPGWLSESIFPHARVLFLKSWLEKLGFESVGPWLLHIHRVAQLQKQNVQTIARKISSHEFKAWTTLMKPMETGCQGGVSCQ